MKTALRALFAAALLLAVACPRPCLAALPQGYLVWIKGDKDAYASRKVYRMTLPGKTEVQALTTGEDVECQISPDGKWVAYAKAKVPSTDYHRFNLWSLHLVSIHGVGDGREELRVDDNGYWPSWGEGGTLYYSQVDEAHPLHTRIMKATLDEGGDVVKRETLFETYSLYGNIKEVNECFVAPDGSWFAARTRGSSQTDGVSALTIGKASFALLGQAGSVGCMPYIAQDSAFGFLAGRNSGILYGEAPSIKDRISNTVLVPPRSSSDLVYHPGISPDGKWFMAAHSTEDDHNAGAYDLFLYDLQDEKVSGEQALVTGGFNGWPDLWIGEPGPPPAPVPTIGSFAPSSWTLVAGEEVTLSWTTSFAGAVTLDGEAVALDGNALRTPIETTRFTLVASNAQGPDTDTKVIEVKVNATAMPVVIDSFTVKPGTVKAGETAVLSWTVTNPTTLDISGTAIEPTGTLEVSPAATTTYVLTANGHKGPVTAQVEVTVEEPELGLLADRGGCQCNAAGRSSKGFSILGFLLLAAMAARGLIRRYR